MQHYKHLFTLPDDQHYINGAYMSPLLKSVEAAGQEGIFQKRNPASISQADFFNNVVKVKTALGQLINAPASQVSMIPSVSYGFANAFNNIAANGKKKAVTIEGEFPSGYFAMKKWCEQHQVAMKVVSKPKVQQNRGAIWNEQLLAAIDENTALVLISSVHWMDGTSYDCKAIGEKCANFGIPFLVDATQTIGAQVLDIQEAKIDVLIASGYKWLLGPYSIGVAYYSERFNQGTPIEESWMNRYKAEDFANLTDYHNSYESGAKRYDVGESSNFILTPMFLESLNFLLNFGVKNIETYCEQLTAPLIDFLQERGYWVEAEAYRSRHLFGFELPASISMVELKAELARRKVYLSFRKQSVRVSPNIYNTENDIQVLLECLKKISA